MRADKPGEIQHLPWDHPTIIPILFPLLTPHAPAGYHRHIPLAKTARQRDAEHFDDEQPIPQNRSPVQRPDEEPQSDEDDSVTLGPI